MFPRTRAKKKNSLKKVEWRARIWGRAWLAKHKRIDYAKRRVTLTNGLWAFFFFCLAGSIIYLPFLYPIVKNDITWPPPPVHNFDRVSLPHNLTKPDNKTEDQVAYVYLNLTTDTDFVVGNELNLSVIVYTTPTLLQNMQAFAVVPDGALIYGPYEHIFNSFVPMKSSYTPNSELLTWSGSQLIEYTVPGSYGLGLSFFNYTKSESAILIDQLHTKTMVSISSRDSLILKRSQSLTMTLTFLLLLFVGVDALRAEKGRKRAQPYS